MLTPKERHQQRERNRKKLHNKLRRRQQFVGVPPTAATRAAPIFPEEVDPQTGVKTVRIGRVSRFRSWPARLLRIFPPSPPKEVVIERTELADLDYKSLEERVAGIPADIVERGEGPNYSDSEEHARQLDRIYGVDGPEEGG